MRYTVSISANDPTASGLNVNVQVDADNILDAHAAAGPLLANIVKASGLMVAPPAVDAAPAAPPALSKA